MRIATLTAAAVATTMLGVGIGEAATYSMSATCISACSNADLSAGDKLTGRLTLDGSTFTPNGSFGDTALQRFSISFGETTVRSDDVAAVHLNGQWGATRRDVPLYAMVGGTTVLPTLGVTFLLSGTSGFVSTRGSCIDANCDAIAGNTATLGPVVLAPIPLPWPALMLGSGLVMLAAVARRGRRARSGP